MWLTEQRGDRDPGRRPYDQREPGRIYVAAEGRGQRGLDVDGPAPVGVCRREFARHRDALDTRVRRLTRQHSSDELPLLGWGGLTDGTKLMAMVSTTASATA